MAGHENDELDLYLASASPRRRELLKQINLRFEVIGGIDIDESQHDAEKPEQYVGRLARDKALAGYFRISARFNGECPKLPPVLGADTCITIDGDIVGKPASRDDGIAMLQRLSGRSHKVLTAITLFDGIKEHYSLCQSVVSMKTLELDEIKRYWETGEPVDKAGAYAIQGGGARFITYLQGSYSGVVGLPLYELSELLQSCRK
jgi:septum formation protein